MLLRSSRLNKERLKEVGLDLEFFFRDMEVVQDMWNVTSVSSIFHILSFSSHTMKKLRLTLPDSASYEEVPFTSLLQVTTIIWHLYSFKELKFVYLEADSAINLTSGSEDSKRLKLSDLRQDYDYYRENNDAVSPEIYTELLEEVVKFTRIGVKSVDYSCAPFVGKKNYRIVKWVKGVLRGSESRHRILLRGRRAL